MRLIAKVKYWAYIVWLSARWIPQVNLGDRVIYKGVEYVVVNGVRNGSWRLAELENGDDGWVPRSEVEKSCDLLNMAASFMSGYRFYMGYWFDIWVREGIEDWMRGCAIWPGKKATDQPDGGKP
jgi:hypothetical protein